MSHRTIKIGDPICVPVPPSYSGCEVVLEPKPKLSTVVFKKDCGIQLQIYQAGAYDVRFRCQVQGQDPEAEPSLFTHRIEVVSPQELQAELQFRVQPWVELPPHWVRWSLEGMGGLIGILVLIFLGRWIWRKWRAAADRHRPQISTWDPEDFLRRLQRLEQDLRQQKQRPRLVAFELTSLFFELSRQAPTPAMKSLFYRAYEESVQQLSELKFNPAAVETGHPLEQLLIRYTSPLREALISKQVESQ